MSRKNKTSTVIFWILILAANAAALLLAAFLFNKYFMVSIHRREATRFLSELSKNAVQGGSFTYRKPHPYVGFKSQPNASYASGETFTESHGFKSPELGAKRPNVIRIAMVGGSVAFQGTPNTNKDDIIAKVSQKLHARGYETEYVNTGVLSFISNQELNVLVDDLLDMDIDILVSLDGFNDIHHVMYYNGRVGWPPMRWDDFGSSDPEVKQECPAYYPAIKPTMLNKEAHARALENYLDNIYKMSKICDAFGVEYVALLQPLRGFGPGGCDLTGVDDVNIASKRRFYCKVQNVFAEWDKARMNNASYVSLAGVLNDKQQLFQDECHFTSEGNEVVANKIVDVIMERKIVDQALSKTRKGHGPRVAVDAKIKYDLFSTATLDDKITHSLNGIEYDGEKRWRWSVGTDANVVVDSDSETNVTVHFSLGNPLPGQSVEVFLNDVLLKKYVDIPASDWLHGAITDDLPCTLRAGKNTFSFRYGLTNGVNAAFAETDKTPYSVYFIEFSIQQVD